MRNNLPLGHYGEDLAAKYLKSQGYKIIERNFRTRDGEIDLVLEKNGILIFAEVKTRFNINFGGPEEAITPWKLKALIRTAKFYKMLHPELPESLRIDAVLIKLSTFGEVENIKHLKNISA